MEGPPLSVDITKMQRVVINLIRNAIEAMPTGGRLTIVSSISSQNVELSVSDTGAGIPEELQERIWKPLKTTKARGVGLGLAICKKLVEAHQGRIEVQSEPGKGATFKVVLPITDQPNKPRPAIALVSESGN
jgi:signal transduction histidine kinase